jgi:hypothetical protein
LSFAFFILSFPFPLLHILLPCSYPFIFLFHPFLYFSCLSLVPCFHLPFSFLPSSLSYSPQWSVAYRGTAFMLTVLTVLARLTLWKTKHEVFWPTYFLGSFVLRTLEHSATAHIKCIVSQLQPASQAFLAS